MAEDYVHRIGRTGARRRARLRHLLRQPETRVSSLKEIEELIGREIPVYDA